MHGQLYQRLERVIDVIARAAAGDLLARVPTEEEGQEQILELEYGVNTLLEEVSKARADSEAQQQEIARHTAKLLEQQQELMRLLSTPVIAVWPGVLALPIIGEVGPERAATMTESVLAHVVTARATHIILDLTGMTVAELATTQSLLRLAQAVQLLGARCLLTGVSPHLARSLIETSSDLSGVASLPTLADAIAHVLRERGVQLVTKKK